jgi:hypothetical protein
MKISMSDIESVRAELKELKRLYSETPDGGAFLWHDTPVLKSYAKYLIEFLEGRIADHDSKV